MKVCSPHCGLSPESGSGGEVYEREVLIRLEAEHHLILARHHRLPVGFDPVLHRPWLTRGLRWWVTPFIWPQVIGRCWRQCRFDLLRAHSLLYAGPACVWARQRYKISVPLVTHVHHLDPPRSRLVRQLEDMVLRNSDLLVADSTFTRSQIAARGCSTPTVVVFPGVDRVRYPFLRRSARPRTILLTIGPLIARKQPAFLLEVLRHLDRQGYYNVALWWIGEGPLRKSMKRLAHEWGIADRVQWFGYVPEDQKLHLMTCADIYVHAATLEGYPLAPMEAMATGLPVVARRGASLPELVGKGGLLAETVADFAGAVADYIDRPAVRAEAGYTASTYVRSWEDTAYVLQSVYDRIDERHNAV